MTVKSTYNFVPAPSQDNVFKPDWADKVSHDIPFSDGESGELELKITAVTPIFIRNGHAKSYPDNSFSNYGDKFFIPGSSLKGMFRNVLEIISFSKLNKKLVNDNRYSFRDLSIGSLYMDSYKSGDVKAGWLEQKVDESWIIHECESFYHMHHEEVDKALGTSFRSEFLNKNPKDKTAKYKYDSCKKSTRIRFDVKTGEDGKPKVIYNESGKMSGTVVLTGQPGRRNEHADPKKKPSGKVHEFVFVDTSDESHKVDQGKKDDFKFIYSDGDSNNISKDWEFWRVKLIKGEKIPIFFTKDKDRKLKHFGLAFMYKLPYENSIHEMSPIKGYGSDFDFAETIFGKTDEDNKGFSLKGRVFIGNAFSKNAQPQEQVVKDILATPKASYFPFYMEQDKNKNNRYTTYQVDGTLRGFKRYPVRNDIYKRQYTKEQVNNDNVFTQYIPLCEGAEFIAKVRFHNLRKTEIGALCSSITFHGHEDECYHSLGGAKSYGYGKVKVVITDLKGLKHSRDEYLLDFENAIDENKIKEKLKELISMAGNSRDETLEYPLLTKDKNEFNDYKKNKEYLEPFSTINKPKVTSINDKEWQRIKVKREKEEALENIRLKEEEEKRAANLLESSNIEDIDNFIRMHPGNPNVPALNERLEELRRQKRAAKNKQMEEVDLSQILTRNFNEDKEILNKMLNTNKQFVFSENQKDDIILNLRDIWKHDQQSFYRKKKLAKYQEYPWTIITKWIGEEKAQNLYNDLLKKHDQL